VSAPDAVDATAAIEFSPLAWRGDSLALLDQTLLPGREHWLDCRTPADVAAAIRRLAVRGAPAIGVAAAYGLLLGVRAAITEGLEGEALAARADAVAEELAATRPTAINLRWALERGRRRLAAAWEAGLEGAPLQDDLLAWAQSVQAADVDANRAMAAHGAPLFHPGDRVLTHCNAGALATAGIGTAIGVIAEAWRQGRVAQVWVDETRPLLQGARLTAWEMDRLGIPHRLITDSSVGALMARGWVQRVVVGADRIARNGDVANKIGTYGVAVLAAHHGVPFYVAAPLSTIDLATPDGAAIPIEERGGDEVTALGGQVVAPGATQALNLAFDVTPHALIAGIITEAGVHEPPFERSLAAAFDPSSTRLLSSIRDLLST
jgi:methylthioribose-1-phosphate isomerase